MTHPAYGAFAPIIARAHSQGCECARCYVYVVRAFVWQEKMHLPAAVYRAVKRVPVVFNASVTTDSTGRTILGLWDGMSITLFYEMIRQTASNGDWRGDVRRTFRHEVAHALGANHAWIDAHGDLNG